MTRHLLWIVVCLTLSVALNAAYSAPPPGSDPNSELAHWFRSLMSPATGVGCCSTADCRVLNDDRWRITDGNYEVLAEDGKWLEVPEKVILQNKENPTGGAVVCILDDIVLCFIRPVEG